MSNDCPLVLNPLFLQRSGTSQKARLRPALAPSFAPVDQHQTADDLVFTHRLAALIKYFNTLNQADGHWQTFFGNDVAVQLALVASQSTTGFAEELKKNLVPLQEGSLPNAQTAKAKAYYGKIYSALFSLAWQIEQLALKLPDTLLLKSVIQTLITTRLKDQLKKLREYNAAPNAAVDNDANADITIFGEASESFNQVAAHTFSSAWNSTITVDPNIYGSGPLPIVRRLFFATNHNFFKDAVDIFIKALARITEEAKKELERTLGNWGEHEPHTTLFLSFLKLLHYSREHLNTLTREHLELYYTDILRLEKKGPQPNQVYVTFELAKFVNDHLVQKGTQLKAGKFANGAEAWYTTDEDIAVNTAVVSHLQSVFISNNEDTDAVISANRVYAAPQANSADGAGAPFEAPLTPWHPFAAKTRTDYESIQQINMPLARVGFAFASRFLYLREGSRTIRISVRTSNNVTGLVKDDFRLDVTTAKGWEPVTITSLAAGATGFDITATMAATQPGTAPYNAALHQAAFTTAMPVLRITLHQNTQRPFAWQLLKNSIITGYEIYVAADRVKNIYVQTDAGVMDPSKPFLAFGAIPHKGAMLMIGCDEIFQKPGATIKPVFRWRAGTVSGLGEVPELFILRHTEGWKVIRHPLNIFDEVDTVENGKPKEHFYIDTLTDIPPVFSEVNTPFSPATVSGFVRYNLDNDLGYQDALTKRVAYLAEVAEKGSSSKDQGVFIPPTLQELYLQYEAATTADAEFFHLYPFGEKEETAAGSPLMPRFLHDAANAVNSLAEFYIGIQQLVPPRKLNLLFQIDESTANPLVAKPEDHVRWHYLSGDNWVPFATGEVADGTNQLIQSGIMAFSMPAAADTGHHLLPAGACWLKATVAQQDEATCKIIAILPQAVSATFNMPEDPALSLPSPLAAATIAKLVEPVPAIKRVQQPFSSFGGFTGETDEQFRTRASELLRHKDRGVNIWDYEHLVLQQFPGLYRAKCIPHTRLEPGKYNEMAPGHVTVITIPDLQRRNGIDPLRPFTYVSELEKVKDYLRTLISPFVQLHVCNPEYEQVQVSASVRFYPEYDKTLFRTRLQEEITRYMAPWAYTQGAELRFESRITKSMIVNFIEEQYYVDYVTDVTLYHKGAAKDSVSPDRQCAIIVPVKAALHAITVIDQTGALAVPETDSGCGCS
ncbi:baseplate J/gp47 family protein [Chitinophaga alhagiae]|uniref:baseplate J/gp47 family protein n=1 Tax=Chitinophaga alhagiae TaxID=2203219 RepID=UPI000E5A8B3B|nr:baseplate J/gp47 family protein [Chitinophaga alhagiae]